MFVSTRSATLVKLLARPAAGSTLARMNPRGLLPFPLALGRLIEEFQTFIGRPPRPRTRRGDHADAISRSTPLDLIARPNAILLGERLWKRNLKLAGYFGHVLTIARTRSL